MQQAVDQQRVAFEKEPQSYRQSLSAYYMELATLQRQLGRLASAAATALERKKLWPGNSVELYNVACELSLCVPLAGKGKDELNDDEQAERSRYADQAVEVLSESVAAGFKNFDHMRQDPDLNPIREHPGYKELVDDHR